MKKGLIMEINERFLTILTPEGEFLRTQKLNQYYQIGQEIEFFPIEQEERKRSLSISFLSMFKGKVVLTTALAAILVIISIIPLYTSNQVYAYMSIDINPSIELGINKNYEVIELIPYNEDGKKIVNQLDRWKKKDAYDVANEIIHEIKSQGYMKNNHEVVIATVYTEGTVADHDSRWNQEMDEIKATIHRENLDLTVMEGTKEDREKAKEKGLTTGLYKGNIVNENKVKTEKEENLTTVPENKKEKAIKINPQKQEKLPPKANDAKQNEKVEVKEDQNSHIPPGQLKKEERTENNGARVKESKNGKNTPPGQEKVKNRGANHTDKNEQKAKQGNNEKNNKEKGNNGNKSHQDK